MVFICVPLLSYVFRVAEDHAPSRFSFCDMTFSNISLYDSYWLSTAFPCLFGWLGAMMEPLKFLEHVQDMWDMFRKSPKHFKHICGKCPVMSSPCQLLTAAPSCDSSQLGGLMTHRLAHPPLASGHSPCARLVGLPGWLVYCNRFC